MLASDIMHPQAITVAVDSSLLDAVRLMVTHRVSGLVVVNDAGNAIGMLTEGDLLRRSEIGTEPHYSKFMQFLRGPAREAGEYLRTHARRVSDLMHQPVVAVTADTKLDGVVAAMEKHHVRSLPVLAGGKPVGIISRADLLRAMAPLMAAEQGVCELGDADLEQSVLAALRAQPWTPPGVTIAIKGSVVTLNGVVTDQREERAVIVLVENQPGVKSVVNDLAYVDVNTGISMTGLG